jgi:hypothetical protein
LISPPASAFTAGLRGCQFCLRRLQFRLYFGGSLPSLAWLFAVRALFGFGFGFG